MKAWARGSPLTMILLLSFSSLTVYATPAPSGPGPATTPTTTRRPPSSNDVNAGVQQRQQCDSIVQSMVNGAVANSSAVNSGAVAGELRSVVGCGDVSPGDLKGRLEQAISQAVGGMMQNCSKVNSTTVCRNLASALMTMLQGGAPGQGQNTGQQQRLLEDGAAAAGSNAMASCLGGNASSLPPQQLQEKQQQCRQQAQSAFAQTGGNPSDFARQLQKQAEDAAVLVVQACLTAGNASADVLAAAYKSSKMDQGTAFIFTGCLNQSLATMVSLGAPQASLAVVESAMQRQLNEKNVASQQACLSGGGTASTCSQQAKASLLGSGVPPQEVNRYVQDNAAGQAADTFASCRRSGGDLVNCTAEAKTLFSGLGGDSTKFNSLLQSGKADLVVEQVKTCRAAAGTNATELKACDAASAASFQMMGGNAQDFKEQRDKAAGDSAASQMRDCMQAAGSDRQKVQACQAQAKADFQSTGASPSDFQQKVQTAAQQLAVSTQQSCLADAGCAVDARTGRQACTNRAAAEACAQASQELMRQAMGKESVSATELKVAAQKVNRGAIADEMSGCASTKLAAGEVQVQKADGSVGTCQADDGNATCLQAAATACKEAAKQAFLSAGGVPADFRREQQAAARDAMSSKMKGCVRTQFDSGNLTANVSGTVITCTWESSSNVTGCMAAARQNCDSATLQALVQSGGSAQDYYKERAAAAATELAGAVTACVDGLLATGNITADMAAVCARLSNGCDDVGGQRRAAAIVCKQSAKATFQLAGGNAADMELQSRQQARVAVGDTYLSCQRLSDTELAAAGDAAVANGSAPTGRRRAACLEEARAALESMGLDASEVHRELRRSASMQASDRMCACLEDANYSSTAFVASGVAATLAAGGANAAASNITLASIRAQCMANVSTAVVQSGGSPGSLQKLFLEGPRLSAASGIRECVRAMQRQAVAANGSTAQPDPADVQACRNVGAASYLAMGGIPENYTQELARAARATARESIWACVSAAGFDVTNLQDRIWGTNTTDRSLTAAVLANCTSVGLDELAVVTGNATGTATSDRTWQLAQMRREAAQEQFEAQLDADAGGALLGLLQAASSLAALGASSPEAAEAELLEQMGCQSLSGTLCPSGSVGPLLLGGLQVCCSKVPVQSVSLSNASVVLGAGEAQVSGPGNFSSAQTDLEQYCLNSKDAATDPSCADVTSQSAASVSGTGGVLGVSGTTVETVAASLTDGTVLDTGVASASGGRRLADQARSELSGYFQSSATVLSNATLSGAGRLDLGRAEVQGDVKVMADTAVSCLTGNATVRVQGRLVLSPDVGVDGNITQGATGRIRIEGNHSLVVDAGEDPVGTVAGRAAMLSVWNITGSNLTSSNQFAVMAAACLRACQQDTDVQAALAECRNSDTRNTSRAPTRKASDVAGIDCGTTLKSCTRTCFLGPQPQTLQQTLSEVALSSAGVTAGKGVQVSIDSLVLSGTGRPPLLLGTPNDAAQAATAGTAAGRRLGEAAGRPGMGPGNGSRPALTVRKVTGAAPLSAGCDLSSFVAGDVPAGARPVPCVQLPSNATLAELHVHLPQATGASSAAVLGRRIAHFPDAGNSTMRRLQSRILPVMYVADAMGNDISSQYQLCCFSDGFGVAPVAASSDVCPFCTTTTTDSTTAASTTAITTDGGSALVNGEGHAGLQCLIMVVLAFRFVSSA